MTVRDTSKQAYHDTVDQRARCQRLILAALQELGATSRRAVAQHTKLDISCVAGRVNELIRAGAVREFEKPQPCPITQRNVHWIEMKAVAEVAA